MSYSYTERKRIRKDFRKLPHVMEEPFLLAWHALVRHVVGLIERSAVTPRQDVKRCLVQQARAGLVHR